VDPRDLISATQLPKAALGTGGDIGLEELVEAISDVMREKGAAFGLFIDEMQDLDPDLLGALLAVQHRASQREWPFFVIGAGLPSHPYLQDIATR
jgi:hypothetical protein